MYDFEEGSVRTALSALIAEDAVIHMPFPFGTLTGPDALYTTCYAPLLSAIPDLERRDWIVTGGRTEQGDDWVGCGGHYTGTFIAPWLDPGPATLDGHVPGPWDAEKSNQSCQHIIDMLTHMKRHPTQGGPEVMEMPKFWHPKMNWYGPAGIGTGRGIAGFRNWHQIPFLNGMPDRGQYVDKITHHFYGDGDYAAVTGWPNMIQTVTHDGWMGIAPAGKKITMCSLDFWRIENGLIRENWVMVDLLDVYNQLGVDVFKRLKEFNKVRLMGRLSMPESDL